MHGHMTVKFITMHGHMTVKFDPKFCIMKILDLT